MTTFHYTAHSKTILADLYTPVGVYMRLRDLYPQSVLMESSDYHDKDNSRSFIGIHPIASIAVSHGVIERKFPDGTTDVWHSADSIHDSEKSADYVLSNSGDSSPHLTTEIIAEAFSQFLDSFHVVGEGRKYCGLYGYTSFNAVRYFENIDVKDETMEKNDAPDILYIFYRDLIVFDHFNNKMTLVTLVPTSDESSASPFSSVSSSPVGNDFVTTTPEADSQLADLLKALNKQNTQPYPFRPIGETTSPLTDEQHKANIRSCIQHCLRGDVFQIVISRRFVQRYEGDDFRLYRVLRSINPSPYLFYFDFGGFRIFGSSPETHCRIEDSTAYIDPIAGTTPRTGSTEDDRRHAEYLRNDPKENAEHVMLVDLARNDLSRNCHNVQVDFYKDMQFYSHVIHLVSRVSGQLDDANVRQKVKAFFDTFPAGTLSGAPKVRAMQIISKLEPHNRGAYGGCLGYIGLDGDLNQAIVIRTFVSRNGELWFQAGSGIVAKSNDEYELQEVNHKLGALVKAIKSNELS